MLTALSITQHVIWAIPKGSSNYKYSAVMEALGKKGEKI